MLNVLIAMFKYVMVYLRYNTYNIHAHAEIDIWQPADVDWNLLVLFEIANNNIIRKLFASFQLLAILI